MGRNKGGLRRDNRPKKDPKAIRHAQVIKEFVRNHKDADWNDHSIFSKLCSYLKKNGYNVFCPELFVMEFDYYFGELGNEKTEQFEDWLGVLCWMGYKTIQMEYLMIRPEIIVNDAIKRYTESDSRISNEFAKKDLVWDPKNMNTEAYKLSEEMYKKEFEGKKILLPPLPEILSN